MTRSRPMGYRRSPIGERLDEARIATLRADQESGTLFTTSARFLLATDAPSASVCSGSRAWKPSTLRAWMTGDSSQTPSGDSAERCCEGWLKAGR